VRNFGLLILITLFIFFSYGYYDGYIQKEIITKKNIYTHVHYSQVGKESIELQNPMSAYGIDYNDDQINQILSSAKELELLGEEKFTKKHGALFTAQVERMINQYKLFLHKKKLLKAEIKKQNVRAISLFGTVSPLNKSIIKPKEFLFIFKNLKKTNVVTENGIETWLVDENASFKDVGKDYYSAIRINIDISKIDNFNVSGVYLTIGNMNTYNPFTWKNAEQVFCNFDDEFNYEYSIPCEFTLPSNYDYDDITAFQFDKIVGYNKPIKIFSIVFEPLIGVKNSIFNLFSRG
jgi:hypothetical protein